MQPINCMLKSTLHWQVKTNKLLFFKVRKTFSQSSLVWSLSRWRFKFIVLLPEHDQLGSHEGHLYTNEAYSLIPSMGWCFANKGPLTFIAMHLKPMCAQADTNTFWQTRFINTKWCFHLSWTILSDPVLVCVCPLCQIRWKRCSVVRERKDFGIWNTVCPYRKRHRGQSLN